MKLLEFAKVNPDTKRFGLGYNRSTRECAVTVQLAEICVDNPDAATVINVVDGAATPGSAPVTAWGAEAVLYRSAMCEEPDDEKWLKTALEKANELIVGRALVIAPITGAQTWINGTGVQSVTLAGTSVAQKATGVIDGRKQWFATVVDARTDTPALHVPPSFVPDLMTGNVIAAVGDAIETVWGDPVVVSEGYERTGSNQNMFWTGDISVYITEVDGLGPHRIARQNDVQITVAQVFAVDLNPCSVVRIGTYA